MGTCEDSRALYNTLRQKSVAWTEKLSGLLNLLHVIINKKM